VSDEKRHLFQRWKNLLRFHTLQRNTLPNLVKTGWRLILCHEIGVINHDSLVFLLCRPLHCLNLIRPLVVDDMLIVMELGDSLQNFHFFIGQRRPAGGVWEHISILSA